jgi:hypothetical protein
MTVMVGAVLLAFDRRRDKERWKDGTDLRLELLEDLGGTEHVGSAQIHSSIIASMPTSMQACRSNWLALDDVGGPSLLVLADEALRRSDDVDVYVDGPELLIPPPPPDLLLLPLARSPATAGIGRAASWLEAIADVDATQRSFWLDPDSELTAVTFLLVIVAV